MYTYLDLQSNYPKSLPSSYKKGFKGHHFEYSGCPPMSTCMCVCRKIQYGLWASRLCVARRNLPYMLEPQLNGMPWMFASSHDPTPPSMELTVLAPRHVNLMSWILPPHLQPDTDNTTYTYMYIYIYVCMKPPVHSLQRLSMGGASTSPRPLLQSTEKSGGLGRLPRRFGRLLTYAVKRIGVFEAHMSSRQYYG